MTSDEAAAQFERFCRGCYQQMLAKAVVVTGGHLVAAQDAVQEAFLKCWVRMTSPNSFPVRDWNAWLSKVVVREALRQLDSGKLLREDTPDGGGVAPDPAADFEFKYAFRRLCQELAGLPQQRRSVVALRFVAGLDVSEVACAMGISESTVRVHCTHARRDLWPVWVELVDMGIVDGGERRQG